MNEYPDTYTYRGYMIIWIEKFGCWCILNENGDKVREPCWGTLTEAREAIDTGEAL